MSNFPQRIAIIGGGPAGLTTGLLLHRHNIPFTIFELRQKPTDEELAKPSGSLDLHEESGLAALKECGLLDEFLTLTGECSEAQRVSDKDGTIIYEDEGENSNRPEISRHALTKLLITHMPDNCIKWHHKLLSATRTNNHPAAGKTEVELDFGSNGKQTFDFVIGADGAWSKVRPILTDVNPTYEGRHNITLTIREITKKYPHLAKFVGSGSFSALTNHHGIMSQRGPQDSARIYIIITTDDEHFATTSGIADHPAAAAKEKLLSDPHLIGNCGPILKELVTVACDEETADHPGEDVDIRPLYVLPVDHSWEHKQGVTLIGDAAHLMGPWAGEGVNLAMWDSLSLSHAIIKAHEAAKEDSASFQSALDPLLRSVEAEISARAKETAEGTYENGLMLFGDDAARAFANFFLSHMPPPSSQEPAA